ncbi:UTP--glucose-1-phosphate uridylyltransferase [Liberibacter crescens BT-1]|uniref:UTP--glucose-1-phosphate uridylyltransferase n=1 Tax=Liberibacter crescens (strain BT-1) TaxID=1215343 RepID=L0ERT4_LIBCB|nr:UTP--glucose-1-phosphate uridylyltransferase GalU [Liberibacter crescens]AGA64209.1 UTP--glucose-1-phosphate uridylyltransferase [Liberibacter crescens BT-1]AMC12459.1 UTP--glucose-1-phosphate uridylyltransferase [Liberibacter crescens]
MISFKKLRKAVFPVAGFGTRLLPSTKAVPKEMVTVVDKPVIQYIVDEALEAGLTHFVFVTGRGKCLIEDYFDIQFELEQSLKKREKKAELTLLSDILPQAGTAIFTRQQEPHGLGHAVWCARHIIDDEPFALLLPDMLMQAQGDNCTKGMVKLYNKSGGNVVAVEECDPDLSHKYGIVGVGDFIDNESFLITDMIEKPSPGMAPSNFFINGRYILQPEIFSILETQERGAGGEIQLTDAMLKLTASQTFSAYLFKGNTYDCGSKEGFVLANIAFALSREDVRSNIEDDLKNLLDALR